MFLKIVVQESRIKSKTIGAKVKADIESGITYAQHQVKSMLSYLIDNKVIQPKLIKLVAFIEGPKVVPGVSSLIEATIVSGKVLATGDIQWMIPPVTKEAEDALFRSLQKLEQDPELKNTDDALYLQGFDVFYKFSDRVAEVLNNLKQPVLYLDINKMGSGTIKLKQ